MLNPQPDSLQFAAVLLLLQPIQIEEVDPVFQTGDLTAVILNGQKTLPDLDWPHIIVHVMVDYTEHSRLQKKTKHLGVQPLSMF